MRHIRRVCLIVLIFCYICPIIFFDVDFVGKGIFLDSSNNGTRIVNTHTHNKTYNGRMEGTLRPPLRRGYIHCINSFITLSISFYSQLNFIKRKFPNGFWYWWRVPWMCEMCRTHKERGREKIEFPSNPWLLMLHTCEISFAKLKWI